jgi:glycosyltransferase involved in cell wall biosynthesis
VLAKGGGDELRSGPEIRAWELARAMSHLVAVTVATRGASDESRADLRVVPGTRRGLLRELTHHDAVIAPWVPAYALALLAGRPTLAVADLYDPVEVEGETLGGSAGRRWLRTARAAREMQLRFADILVCASERQHDELREELRTAVPPGEARPSTVVVPFGLGPPPPPATRRPLRERFPAIGPDDPVVLWWGSLWRWMDPETAVRAVALLRDRHPGVRLVFSAGRPPGAHVQPFAAVEGARELARSLGLLDLTVFFLEEWIPYERRHEHLLEADVAINLHRDPAEGGVSARARYMDFLWASLPSVVSAGNEVAERFARAGFAIEVPIGDPERTAAALERLVSEGPERRRARAAAAQLAADYRWERLVEPLLRAISAGVARGGRDVSRRRAAARAARYYAIRLRQLAAERLR